MSLSSLNIKKITCSIKMIPLYSSKKTDVKLTPNGTVIKTIKKPSNEKEYEAQILAHKLGIAPKVISHNFDNVDKVLTIEMEHINGTMIDNYLRQPNADKRRAKHALFIALNKLYNNGIDHKDLCGENIIVVTQGGKVGIKILDYGDVKVYSEPIQLRLRDYSSFNNRNW
jgi:tRNA A-37 threonylcarbamoyl transferase component Bud32